METSYKEKYEKALEKAKEYNNVYKDHTMMSYAKGALEEIFPELAESEEKPNGGIVREDFTQGDGWYKVNLDYLSKAQVEEIEQLVEKWNPKEVSEEEKIKKAILIYLDWLDGKKDYLPKGDYTIKDMILWLERQGEHANFLSKIQVGDKVTRNENGVLVNLSQLKRVAKPSEKQCEQKFEMKTAEESLGIDSDTYNKIVDECIFGEQKPEENKGNIGGISANWSEEDERLCQCLIEDQEEVLDKVIIVKYGHSEIISDLKEIYRKRIDWLKSLKGRVQLQNRWKPSDEQMKALNYVVNLMASSESPKENDYYYNVFKDLRKQLKKLKEGKV